MGIGSILNATGGKSFSFADIGATVTGAVESADVVQKRNFDTNELEFWDDGKPIEQVRVTLQTSLRDPDDADDDGLRSVYIKGWGDQLRELRRAIKAANASDIEAGGTFTATYVRDGELAKGKRGFPPKVYQYTYQAPSATAGLVSESAAPLAQQAAPAPAAVQQPAATPAQAQPTAEELAAFQQYMASQQGKTA